MRERCLQSTMTGAFFPFERIEEYSREGESLEVRLDGIATARIRSGNTASGRYREFMPFAEDSSRLSLGEGSTPLIGAGAALCEYAGIGGLYLKNETANPTWSFKDRGSIACAMMASEMGEGRTATISTGNMGHSMSAYGARAGIGVMVFVPGFVPEEKIRAMAFHGARIIRVGGCEYAEMKQKVLSLAGSLGLRIVSGNGAIRVEGYKTTAFELYEQFGNEVPDWIAVPTSACGHIRGIFKGFRELLEAGYTDRLPRMIVVQATNNSPLVSAIKQGLRKPVPFRNFTTLAEALTSGDPPGGDEILDKAYKFGWLAESASEDEILESQRVFAASGFFVEPGTATILPAVRKLARAGSFRAGEKVVLMLTGSGLKDMSVFSHHTVSVVDTDPARLERDIAGLI